MISSGQFNQKNDRQTKIITSVSSGFQTRKKKTVIHQRQGHKYEKKLSIQKMLRSICFLNLRVAVLAVPFVFAICMSPS